VNLLQNFRYQMKKDIDQRVQNIKGHNVQMTTQHLFLYDIFYALFFSTCIFYCIDEVMSLWYLIEGRRLIDILFFFTTAS
jgi:hypothetical protein